MNHLVIACLIAVNTTAASAQSRSALRVIREDGALLLVEGGSFYRFKSDSSFDSGPIGLSGRTIRGRWRGGDDVFIIEGSWGWINGIGATDDYRRMTMRITRIDGPGVIQSLPLSGVVNSVRVHGGYYYIDDVVRIPAPDSVIRAISARGARAYTEIHISTNHILHVAGVRWRLLDARVGNRWELEIDFGSTLSATTLPRIQVWLLRNDGSVIAPTRAAVMTGGGFGGTGPSKADFYYDRAVDREAAAILVKIGAEYLLKSLGR